MKTLFAATVAIAALTCAGSAAYANSVNGTDEYKATVLQLPGCQGTGALPSYCNNQQNATKRMGEHPAVVGTPQNQKVNSQ